MRALSALSQRRYYARDQGEVPGPLRDLFSGLPDEIVQPATPEEAVEAVREQIARGRPVIARGAGSTAFGQVVPMRGGRVIDLCFMKGISGFDAGRATVRVEAGVRWSDLSAYLDERGFALGSYPSSWYTTVGGWIATGGLGLNSLRFGALKKQIVELRVCTPAALDLKLSPNDRLFDAFFETEGQMGLILEAELKVRPKPAGSFPHLAVLPSVEAAWQLLEQANKDRFALTHASVYNAERMSHFNRSLDRKLQERSPAPGHAPFSEQPSLLLHVETEAESRRLAAWLKDQAAPAFQAAFVWMERFYPLKGKKPELLFLGNEQVVPNAAASAYCRGLERLAAVRRVPLAIESNAADEDRSVIIASFYCRRDDDRATLDGMALVFEMDELGWKHGGRPYHVGVYNSPFIDRRFPERTLDRLRALKSELDPRRLFNPGKFFEVAATGTRLIPAAARKIGAQLVIRMLRTEWGRRMALRWLPPSETHAGNDDRVRTAALECVNCGFCLPVCPAYLATGDERTTARGKLFLASTWLAGQSLAPDDVERLHSCMHCAGCTRVCQSAIDLVPVWDELERRVAQVYGKPASEIEKFVRQVEASADYKRLLRRGFISNPRAASSSS